METSFSLLKFNFFKSFNSISKLGLMVLFTFVFVLGSKAQYSTTHYIPPSPWTYLNNANELEITTVSTTPVSVTIKSSDGTIIDNSLTTVSGSPLQYRFKANGVSPNLFNTVISGQGLIISAISPIGVQVRNIATDNVTCAGGSCYGGNPDCAQKGNSSFTSLGDQGLGTSFRLGYYANVTGISCNGESAAPVYGVMARDNGTNIYLNGKLVTTLNAGQSYLLQAAIGSQITSNNPIVTTSGMRIDNSSGCGDGVCSQMIPESYLGTSYIIVRSSGNTGYEKSTIVASQANTTVTVKVNGGNTKTYTLTNAGDYITINNGDGSNTYSSCYVTSSLPVAVYTGSASGCEIDMIAQPPLSSCAGSFDVQTTKFISNDNTGDVALPYFGYILVQSDTAKVYFNGIDLETLTSKRTQVSGSGFYIIQFTNTQLGNPTSLHFNVNARINVAMVESGGGYSMSSFISSISNSMPPPSITSSCLPSTFTAQPGFASYQWYKDGVLISGITTQTYIPSSTGKYSVAGNSLSCGSTTISPTVTLNAKPNAGIDQIACAGTTINLTGTTPTTATWVAQANNPTGATLSSTTNGIASLALDNTAVGSFNFIYNSGCTDTMSVTVKAISSSTTNASICSNSSYTFNGTTYSTSGTYTVHLTNSAGCDSIATLNLTVKATSTSTKSASICAGSSYTFNGTTYTSSGTYVAHLTNSLGCDSAATLVLIVNPTSTSTTNASICTGGSYTFNGSTYTTAGTYLAHLTNSRGCDSAATLVLTVKSPSASTTSASICSGSSYSFNGVAYTNAGTYTAHLTNAIGCDSAATLVLTVKANTTSTTNASVISGNSYLFNGTNYTSAGTYTKHLTNSAGCDSAATLVLTVTTLSTTSATICAGSSYLFNGTSYTTSGTYTKHLINSTGGDSVATLVLTVKPLSSSTTNASICSGSSYTFNGTVYTTAGTYTYHTVNSAGCDSAASLILTVKALSTSTTNASICSGSSYTFNGSNYTTAGTYTAHLTNAAGCDSTATLVLTVKALSSSTTVASICSGSSYTFNGTAYTTAGTYTIHLTNSVGCDSAATLVLTLKAKSSSTTTASICSGSSYLFNGTSYSTSGTYTVHFTNSVGCDSAASLVLTVNPNPTVAAISGEASICEGSTKTYTNTTSGGVWTSSNTTSATINPSGSLSGIAAGATTINYSVTSLAGCSTTVTKSVTINAVPAVTPITGSSSICLGSTTTLSNTTFGGTWSSNNTNIATINSSGVVNGVTLGSTSISYSLSSGAGCNTTVTSSINVGSSSSSTTNASICAGGSYTFNGTTYTTAGTYTAHLTNAVGCDSAATLVLTVKPLSTSTTNASICASGSYTFNGTAYSTAGSYTAHLTNAIGCDSAATLVLTVKPLSTSTTNASICAGGSYTFNGATYSTAGTYTSHLTNSVGCDSAATLVLTVKPFSTSTTNASICNGGSYTFNGTNYTTAGTYTAHLTNAVGCDSAATLVLTVKALSTSTTNASICNGGSYTFNGTNYTTAGTYTAHLTNAIGCDSAATLVLTVKPLSTSTTNASICAGGSYTFNGTNYTSAGSSTAHLTNAVGCDSAATLVLTVKHLSTSTTNASICAGGSYTFNGTVYTSAGTYTAHLTNAAGCDSAATLVLTVKSLSTSTTNASICAGGSYTFNGTVYTTAGTYTAHLTNAVGCDSAATLVLTVKSLSTSTTNASICAGGSYTFNGTTYTTAGIYTRHLTNSVGCDSAATLALTVKPISISTTNASICAGGSYTFNGTTYTSAGTYTAHLTNAVGCDSAATLVLTVKPLSTSTTNASICAGGSYTFNGTVYTTAGTYTAHLNNAVGCDSAATLVLKIKAKSTSSTNITACSSYVWNGTTYTASGTYTYSTLNALGCDSTATLNLIINQPSTSSTNITACSSYVWNGTTYTASGTYTFSTTNAVGCDSTATLNLTINQPSASNTNITACSSYTWNSTTYTTSGTYTYSTLNALGCDSTATLNLIINQPSTSSTNISACSSYVWNGTTYTASGTYTYSTLNALGCDSTATLNLIINQPSNSTTNITACSSYVWNGITYTASGTYTHSTLNAVGCDSTATLNLIINQPSNSTTNITSCSSYTWNGITYYTSGTFTYTTTNAVGCDSIATLNLTINQSTTSTTIASICAGSHYIFNGSSFNTSGTYLVHLSNSTGCDSIAKLVLTVISSSSHIDTIMGNTVVCAGASIPLLDSTSGGKWFSTDTSIATIDSLTGVVYGVIDGTSTIHYIVSSAAGCADTASVEITVGCGYVTPGSTGGLESKSLGAAIGTRNFNAYKESKNGIVEFTAANQINLPNKGHYATMGIDANNSSLAAVMPYRVNGNYLQYDESSTVADLKSITNAIEIRTVDFTLNNKPKAVAFATKTVGAIYGHTKPICDRLKGAELLNVENVKIQGYTFIRYALAQPEGEREYAISFTAGQKVGRNSYSIQSDWLMPDYIGEDTMINYQLWAASPADLNKMVTEILSRLTANMPLQQLGASSDLPDAYISSIHRIGTDVKVTINNKTANTSGYFVFDQKKNENTTIGNNVVIPFTINPNGKTTITIPIADVYDANIDMFFNNKKEDMVYMADGIWGTSSDKNTSVAQFKVTNDNNRQYNANEYALLRNVSVQATTSSYLTVYKYLKGGAAADNLSAYKTFKFTTNTSTGGLNLRVTITKKSISNWNSQYTYLITGLQDGQAYKLSLANFKSTDSTLPSVIDMSDITSIVYNIENPSGQTVSFNVGINNAAFSTEDLIYEQTLNVKTVGLYPNPNNGNFKVSFASAVDAKLQLTVIDNTGRQVANIPIDAIKGKNEVSVNLNNRLMNSVYYVSLQGAGTKYNTVKFIIKR